MWIISPIGFMSIVRKDAGKSTLAVRFRSWNHAEEFRRLCPVDVGEIILDEGTDYPYRLYVEPEVMTNIMIWLVDNITYTNFKNHLMQIGKVGFHHQCSRLWSLFFDLDQHTQDDHIPEYY